MKKLSLILSSIALLCLGIVLPKVKDNSLNINKGVFTATIDVTASNFEELKQAFSNTENVNVQLLNDIVVTETINLSDYVYTITSNRDVTLLRDSALVGDLFYINSGSTLHIGNSNGVITIDGNSANVKAVEGSLIDNRGTLELNNVEIANADASCEGSAIYNGGTCTVNDAEIHDNLIDVSGHYSTIYSAYNSRLTINDGNFYNNKTTYTSGAVIYADINSVLNVEGGKYYNNISGGRGSAFNIKNCQAMLKNVEIYDNQAGMGGAIHIYSQANVNLTNLKLYQNTVTESGGAVSVVSSNVEMKNVEMTENTSNIYGGAVYVEGDSELNIDGGKYNNNTSFKENGNYGHGGAIYITGNVEATISNAEVKGNQSTLGGAIYVSGASVDIENTNILGNESVKTTAGGNGSGAGLYVSSDAQVNLNTTKIAQNASSNIGGAITVNSNADVTMYDSKLYNNTAAYGAGVYVDGGDFVQQSGDIMYNTSTASGCGVFIENGSYTLNDGNLSFNQGGSNGGAINNKDKVYINGGVIEGNSSTWYGAGIHSYIGNSNDTEVVVTGGTFKNNGKELTINGESATLGAGKTYGGGAINVNNGKLKITGGTFIGNATGKDGSSKYGYGGAVYVQGGSVEISGATFAENQAPGGGGAIYFKSLTEKVNINNVTFNKNSSTAHGGAIYSLVTTLEINNSTFTNNTAVHAGGIKLHNGGTLYLNDNTFNGNSATDTTEARGKDVYIEGDNNTYSSGIAIINNGTYDNLAIQYGRISFGGDITLTEHAKVFAGKQAAYAHFIIHDELKNPITVVNKWTLSEISTDTNLLIRLLNETGKDPYRLVGNIRIKDDKTRPLYAKYYPENGAVVATVCEYVINPPSPIATTVQLGANANDVVSFKAIEGYNISNVKYNGTLITPVDGVYSFTMPSVNVELTYDLTLSNLPILIDSEAEGLLSVPPTATMEEEVEVELVKNKNWLVTNVYTYYKGQKTYLQQKDGKYYFDMFIGVELFVEKTKLYQVSFADNEYLSEASVFKVDGEVIESVLAGKTISVEMTSNSNRFVLDIVNSYYMIEGSTTKHSISTLTFEMPEANVVVYPVFIDIYEGLNNAVEVTSFNQLKTILESSENKDIVIIENIEVSQTITLAKNTTFTIVAANEKTIKRASGFTGAMFHLTEFTVLNLGFDSTSNVLTTLKIDGNKNVVTNATGSIFVLTASSELYVNKGTVITNNKITTNEYAYDVNALTPSITGGSAILNIASKVVINGGAITENESTGYGGAIYNFGYVELNSGTISNNSTSGYGGAIANQRTAVVNGGTISNNKATGGAGIYNFNDLVSMVTVNGGKFENNETTHKGAGIYIEARSVGMINYGEFINNKSKTSDGGAIYVAGILNVYGGLFKDNSANGMGGAICLNVGHHLVLGTLKVFGGIFENNSATYGGAIAVNTSATLHIENSTAVFKNNTATRGGAIYLNSSSDTEPSIAIITSGTFEGNSAPNGTLNGSAVGGPDIAVQYGQLHIGGSVKLNSVRTVANPTEYRGFVKIIKDLEHPFEIMPIAYREFTGNVENFIKVAEGVNTNNVIEKINVIQPTSKTYYFEVVDGNIHLRERTYKITIANGLEKAIDVVGNGNKDEVIEVKVKQGYTVSNLQANGTPINAGSFVMPGEDVEITYTYSLIEYQVQVLNTITNGTVVVDKETTTVKELVTITVTPNKGYHLVSLTINGKDVEVKNGVIEIVISNNSIINATFEQTKYYVCYNYSYGNKYDSMVVKSGTVLDNKTPKRSGYTFGGWYTDKEYTSEYDFSTGVYEVTQLYAKWIKG